MSDQVELKSGIFWVLLAWVRGRHMEENEHFMIVMMKAG